jgi:hypothetical protein
MRHEIVRSGMVAVALAAVAIGCSKSPTAPSETAGGTSFTVIQVTLGGNLSLPEGGTSQLTASASKSDGTTQDVTSQATWNSSDPTVATVSAAGLLSSLREGATSITAAFGAQTGRATAQVTAPLFDVTIVANSVTAVSSCDSVFDGSANGEFAVRTQVFLRNGTTVPVHSTDGYPGDPLDPVFWNVADGGTRPIGSTKTFTIPGRPSEFVSVEFGATEWDQALVVVGGTRWVHDSRMDGRLELKTHQFSNGALLGQGPNTVQLGDAACGIRLNYTISMTKR